MANETSTLSASLRPLSGKGPARQLRMKGLIPAVCYGRFDKPVHVALDPNALKKAIATPHKFNTVLTLKIEGGTDKTVLFKAFERDPLDGKVLHADFLEVRLDQDVDVPVPVVLAGRPVGLAEGGILQQVLRLIVVRCKPGQIPEKIEVDVSHLNVTESVHVSDVKSPAGILFITSGEQTIAVVAIPEKEEVVVKAVAVEGAVPAAGAVAGAPAVGADGKPVPAADGKAAPAADAKAGGKGGAKK